VRPSRLFDQKTGGPVAAAGRRCRTDLRGFRRQAADGFAAARRPAWDVDYRMGAGSSALAARPAGTAAADLVFFLTAMAVAIAGVLVTAIRWYAALTKRIGR